uniref:Uncharacterized protein n=1 Tax=Nothobranchius furzeri TaxID=105023 RepID=A0A1A8VE58_NOTFU
MTVLDMKHKQTLTRSKTATTNQLLPFLKRHNNQICCKQNILLHHAVNVEMEQTALHYSDQRYKTHSGDYENYDWCPHAAVLKVDHLDERKSSSERLKDLFTSR